MAHTHDGVDWAARLGTLRRTDVINAARDRGIAERLVGLPGVSGPAPVVVDVGAGAGGMAAALAGALGGGGRVVVVDAVEELLSAATAWVGAAAADGVSVEAVLADAGGDGIADALPAADLVWAARVVHHLPDQQRAIERLVSVVAPGGWLAIAEGGLRTQCLPWDLGLGTPGLGDRLTAARDAWFLRMRAQMPGAVRLPVGWGRALGEAGLTEVSSFSVLTDEPAPAGERVRLFVVDWLRSMSGEVEEYLDEEDRNVVRRLLDPDDEAYVANRDDLFVLGALTVHYGRKAD